MTSQTPTTLRPYIVMTSSAKMPSTCRGRYRNVAVVKTDGELPAMISERAKHVERIMRHWPPRSVGKTERSQYAIALREAEALAQKLNDEHEPFDGRPYRITTACGVEIYRTKDWGKP